MKTAKSGPVELELTIRWMLLQTLMKRICENGEF